MWIKLVASGRHCQKRFWAIICQCRGGEKGRQRLTFAFFVNAKEKKEFQLSSVNLKTHIVSRRSAKASYQSPYISQKKAWMSGEIMDEICKKKSSACHLRTVNTTIHRQ